MEKERSTQEVRCQWCGNPVEYSGRGRKPKYCSRSCRQRAYEQRHEGRGVGISDSDIVMRGKKAQYLFDSLFFDSLFELRCAAEDINTAAQEGATSSELAAMTGDLVSLARDIESIRLGVEQANT